MPPRAMRAYRPELCAAEHRLHRLSDGCRLEPHLGQRRRLSNLVRRVRGRVRTIFLSPLSRWRPATAKINRRPKAAATSGNAKIIKVAGAAIRRNHRWATRAGGVGIAKRLNSTEVLQRLAVAEKH